MNIPNLAAEVGKDPFAAQSTYASIEQALNLVLPGSAFHERYRDVEGVGLALVVGEDGVAAGTYNPLLPDTLSKLAFWANNRSERLGLWNPLETDAETLGGEVPASLGRFTAFALAKINTLTTDKAFSSHRSDIRIAPGQVGFAGGRRAAGALLSMSGLWEVHDDVATRAYASEMSKTDGSDSDDTRRTTDELAEAFEAVFETIQQRFHQGTEAADLSRDDVGVLLRDAAGMLNRAFPIPVGTSTS